MIDGTSIRLGIGLLERVVSLDTSVFPNQPDLILQCQTLFPLLWELRVF